jgi:glycosyltransferase involved in cell wall biosynthesis
VIRVLVVTNLYPPHHYGGYEVLCRDVVEGFRRRGHEVTVLTGAERVAGVTDPPEERATGVRRDLALYWRDHELLRPPWRERLRIEQANQRALASALDAARPDVVSVWHMGGASMGLLATLVARAVPVVYVVCDDWLDYGPRLDAWLRPFLCRPRLGTLVGRLAGVPASPPAIGRDGTFCFASETVRRRALATEWWQPAARTAVVYNGVDTTLFSPAPDHSGRPWRWRLLYVGRIDPRKGIETAVRALPLFPAEATLTMLGRGDEDHRRHLEAVVAELGVGDRVQFGVADRADLPDHYRAADAVVFPVTWEEPFGLVPVEAMACGTPVVATGTGGSGEYLADGDNCLLHPPGDADALATAVTRLADDPALRGRLVAGGLTTATALDFDPWVELLEAWHLAAADRFRSPTGRVGRGRPTWEHPGPR